MKPLRATYRLQLNKEFTLRQAADLVPYLDDLGVSHAYLSPVLKAQPGSTHGYDTVDHTLINPELGTIEDFRALAHALQARHMGVILDFVPNHMGVGGAHNTLWLDVLRNGQASRFAEWFDIDWSGSRPGMEGKVLVPFLGKSYAEVLADGDIALKADNDGFSVWVYEKEKLPIRPEDAEALIRRYGRADAVVAAHAAPNDVDQLIAGQHWRLAHFAAAGDEINYRRFFINSELAGIRIERPEVFDHAHQLIFALIEDGLVDGLRIDHIDGLVDPLGYLQTLRAKSPRSIYLAVEKILAPHEYLREDWPVEGTTGYEIGAQLTRVLTRASSEAAVTGAYETAVGPVASPRDEAFRCKLRVMDNELSIELTSLARLVAHLAWSVPTTVDLSEISLKRALRETIAHLEVYRTYIDQHGVVPRDRRELSLALGRARRSQPQIQPAVFDFLGCMLCGDLRPHYSAEAVATAIAKFQQYTGPVMAKGLEDTALYRYNRLVSLNEVGAHPDRFGLSMAAFHESNRRRLARHPDCMIATSTHDTKRGEDTRMVIATIADDPDHWADAVEKWQGLLAGVARGVHPNDVYLFFQLLLGGWPIGANTGNFTQRLKGSMLKSLREARQRSDWGVNNELYEASVLKFVEAALDHAEFPASFQAIREPLVQAGRRKALIQTVLKFTIPGVPDVYRGAEDWEQSFVDPDNRRLLNFEALTQRLANPSADADAKLILTQRLLRLRRHRPALFARGSYEPIDAGSDVLAFRRAHREESLTVLADLSPMHKSGFPAVDMEGDTVAGSRHHPFWILECKDDRA